MMEKQQRLIDADALYKKFLHLYETDKKATGANAYDLCAMLTEDAPTIDAVPVVRCKDCRFRGNPLNCPMCYEEDYYDEDDGFDYIERDETVDEGYCQKGEREDGNDTP